MLRSLLALTWMGTACFLVQRNWNPLEFHPLSMFTRELPMLASDIGASFIKLFSDGIPALFYLLLLGFAALGAGGTVLRRLKLPLHQVQLMLFSFALGLGIIAYYMFFLGCAGGYTKPGLIGTWIFMLLLMLMGVRDCYGWVRQTKRRHMMLSSFCWVIFFIVISVFLLSKALWPAVQVDALMYHLGIPNYYLQEGGISYIPYDYYCNFPFVAEMLYTVGLFIANQQAAQLSSVLVFLMAGIAVYDFSKTCIPEISPVLPAMLFLATPSFMLVAVAYGNDLHLLFYWIMTVYGFYLWERSRNDTLLVLAGCCAGICLGIKYTALMFVPILLPGGICFSTLRNEGRNWQLCLRRVALCMLPACALFLPWLIKNFINTGNPLYPAFFPVLGGKDMSSEAYTTIQLFTNISRAHNLPSILYDCLKEIFLFSHDIFQQGGPTMNLGLGLLFWLPLLVLCRKPASLIKHAIVAAATLFFLWGATYTTIRFFYPGYFFLLIVAAYAMGTTCKHAPAPVKIFLFSGMCLCLFVNMCMGFYHVNMHTQTYGFNFLNQTNSTYLLRHMIADKSALLDSYPVYEYINGATDPTAVVLIIGDAQHLYIKRRHRYAYIAAASPYEVFREKAGLNGEIAQHLRSQGITHIVYNPHELARLQEIGAVAYKKENTVFIEKFLQSPFVREIFAHRRPYCTVYLYQLL